MRRSSRAVDAAIVLLPLVLVGQASPGNSQEPTTGASMRGIYQALTTAYKYSVNLDRFEDPANHATIQSALEALVTNTGQLEAHGGGLDPSFGYLRRSLARDALEALNRFEQRQYMGAQFMLNKLTENCVTCHSRLPAKREFSLGARFLEEAGIENLHPVDRVNIEIATRQFDKALDTYEEIFELPNMTPAGFSLIGAFEGYLKICIGVVEKPDRAIATFTKFKKRTDMPSTLKRLVSGWIHDLEGIDLASTEGNELAAARSLIKDAEIQKQFPTDRRGLVDFVTASAVLHRYMRSSPTDGEEVAEAFYLLAVAESYITRSFWISETDYLLEKAIRRAPKSRYAKKSFDFLEEYTHSGYGEAAQLPPEQVQANLDELRRLIED